MKRNIRRHRFCGKLYDIDFEGAAACTTSPKSNSLPFIMFNEPIENTRRSLELMIHEGLHACDYSTSEEKVRQTAADIAYFVWRRGFRLKE